MPAPSRIRPWRPSRRATLLALAGLLLTIGCAGASRGTLDMLDGGRPQCDEATPCPPGYECVVGICYLTDLMLRPDTVTPGLDVLTPDAPLDVPQTTDLELDAGEDLVSQEDGPAPDALTADAPEPVDQDPGGCPEPADCLDPRCEGLPCGPNGRVCQGDVCVCPGGQTNETSCADGRDNDCDGLIDCMDPDCDTRRCGAATDRCCGRACVDTTSDEDNCGGCGIVCQDPDGTGSRPRRCRRVSDADGTRGHCECVANTMCNNNPGQICRSATQVPEQNGLCACNNETGCAPGQVCEDVVGANFCHY